jgi:hypothetical protein
VLRPRGPNQSEVVPVRLGDAGRRMQVPVGTRRYRRGLGPVPCRPPHGANQIGHLPHALRVAFAGGAACEVRDRPASCSARVPASWGDASVSASDGVGVG